MYVISRLCGANFRAFRPPFFFVADPRDNGFPLNRGWHGVDKAKVLNNQDRSVNIFVNMSVVLSVFVSNKH